MANLDRETKNQKAWAKLFSKRNIKRDLERKGFHLISAQDIGDEREARLMTKFDRTDLLPEILLQEDCVPLSISRTHYALIRPKNLLFTNLKEVQSSPVSIPIDDWRDKIVSFPWGQVLKSEAQAIDLAFLLPIFTSFFEEGNGLWATIRGRTTLKHEVPIRFLGPKNDTLEFPFAANGVQVEFDGGYESPSSIYLVEAKINIPPDVNLRQFYFPYWYWAKYLEEQEKTKPVRLIFLAYSAHVYNLYEFQFQDTEIINSLEEVRSARYMIGEKEFSWRHLSNIIASIKAARRITETPFPQADEFERVLNVVELIDLAEQTTAPDLAENYEFSQRQGEYYANAARWLGWLEKTREGWAVTSKGKSLLKSRNLDEMATEVSIAFCQSPGLRESIELMSKKQALPSIEEIVVFVQRASENHMIKAISKSTIPRRAQTIRAWLRYLHANLE